MMQRTGCFSSLSPPLSSVHTDRQYLGRVGEDVALVYGGTTPLGSIAMSHPSPYWWAPGVTARSGASQWETGEEGESVEVGGPRCCSLLRRYDADERRQRTLAHAHATTPTTPRLPSKKEQAPQKPSQSIPPPFTWREGMFVNDPSDTLPPPCSHHKIGFQR